MKIMSLTRIGLFVLNFAAAALLSSGPALGAPLELSEPELAEVNAQGLAILTNSSYDGLDFSRIALNADVTFNANFRNISLGQYNYAPNNGTGADITVPLFQFGRSDGTAEQRLVKITNPYLEFVYNNAGGPGNSQVVGMRIGFDGIAGDIGLIASSISGSLLVDGGAAGVLDINGKRLDNSTCVAPCLTLPQIGGVTAGNATGPSRDFWISLLAAPVQFQGAAGMALPNIAQAGVWMNWRDRLTAFNTTGTPPPNLPLGR